MNNENTSNSHLPLKEINETEKNNELEIDQKDLKQKSDSSISENDESISYDMPEIVLSKKRQKPIAIKYKMPDEMLNMPKYKKNDLLKTKMDELRDICRVYDIPHSNKNKLELVSSILKFQRTGITGRIDWIRIPK